MKLLPGISSIIFAFFLYSLSGCSGYLKLNLEIERSNVCDRPKLFGSFGLYTESLQHHEDSAVVLDDEFSYHPTRWKNDLNCTFKVKHPSETDGVIAVIQSITMRRNESNGECIDYIRFKSKDGFNSDKFCGKFDAFAKMNNRPTALDIINFGNAFRTRNHKMYVDVTIGKTPFRTKEKIKYKVVFTAYRNCSRTSVMDVTYKPCREFSDFCIFSSFFDDGYVNCPLPGCSDEGSCSKFAIVQKTPSVGTRLLVSSISFLFVLFVCFLISIWACKKHKVVCFSQRFSQPNLNRQLSVDATSGIQENARTNTVLRMVEQINISSPPSAPVDLDKDSPPKYEDLFPDR